MPLWLNTSGCEQGSGYRLPHWEASKGQAFGRAASGGALASEPLQVEPALESDLAQFARELGDVINTQSHVRRTLGAKIWKQLKEKKPTNKIAIKNKKK